MGANRTDQKDSQREQLAKIDTANVETPTSDKQSTPVSTIPTSISPKYKEFSKEELQKIYAHYNRKEILAQMVRCSQNKEVVGSFGGVGYAKRPNIIEYEQDILAEVKRGITSFHASEELWSNPLSINTDLKKNEVDALRIGWDLILDIDCKELDYSKIAADFIIRALTFNGISSVSVKFSGNHGFHIAVPWEAFPQQINGRETKLLFPEAPRSIAEYLKSQVERKIGQALFDYERQQQSSAPVQQILDVMIKKCALDDSPAAALHKSLTYQKSDDGSEVAEFDAFLLVGIDTILITGRHLYRQVYSVNEKSGLISIPLNPHKLLLFDKKLAKLENFIVSKFQFLDRENATPGEATGLLIHAYDHVSKRKHEDETTKFLEDQQKKENAFAYEELTEKIPKEFFPPQIEALFKPLQDGKKRAMFILINFLRCSGYSNTEIEAILIDWNQKHPEPIRDTFFKGQLKAAFSNTEKIPPPNYTDKENIGKSKYVDITGIPLDPIEARMRNPLAFAKAKYSAWIAQNSKPKRGKKKENNDDKSKEKDETKSQDKKESKEAKTQSEPLSKK